MKNRKLMIAAIIAGILILGGGSTFAAGQIAKSNAIGEENARNFAYVDAGILPEEARVISTEFEFKRGKFVYEIEFEAGAYKYEYTIDSSSGIILEKELEALPEGTPTTDRTAEVSPTSEPKTTGASENTTEPENTTASQNSAEEPIGIEKAKAIALNKAGISEKDAAFTEVELKRGEKTRKIYEIEFVVDSEYKYEYEIDALTGEILEESYEKLEFESIEEETESSGDRTLAETKPAPSEPSTSSTPLPLVLPKPEKTEQSSEIIIRPTEPAVPDTQPDEPAKNISTISVEDAKNIALRKAGLSASQVIFSKAKLENENGKLVYEIEFFITGQTEYEYEIDAFSGSILDEDIEPWEGEGEDD